MRYEEINMDRKTKVILLKQFSYGERAIYSGTLRKARKLVPPSKKDQYRIVNLETGETI